MADEQLQPISLLGGQVRVIFLPASPEEGTPEFGQSSINAAAHCTNIVSYSFWPHS